MQGETSEYWGSPIAEEGTCDRQHEAETNKTFSGSREEAYNPLISQHQMADGPLYPHLRSSVSFTTGFEKKLD